MKTLKATLPIPPLIITTSLASALVVPMITLSGEPNDSVFNPSKSEAIDDTMAPLGSFYFSSSKKGIIKKTSKKRKLEEAAISDKPKHMLWNLVDIEPQQMEKDTVLTVGAFANVSSWTIDELSDELN